MSTKCQPTGLVDHETEILEVSLPFDWLYTHYHFNLAHFTRMLSYI